MRDGVRWVKLYETGMKKWSNRKQVEEQKEIEER